VDEVGIDAVTGRKLVRVDPRYFPAHGSGDPAGRRHKGTAQARLERRGELLRIGGGNGRNQTWISPIAMPWSPRKAFKVYSHHE